MSDDTPVVSQQRGRHSVTAGAITWDYVSSQLGKPLSPLKLCVWGFRRITDTARLIGVRKLKIGLAYCRLTREFPSSLVRHTVALIDIAGNEVVTSLLTGETRSILHGSFIESSHTADERFPRIQAGREFGVIFSPGVPWPQSRLPLPEDAPEGETLQELATGPAPRYRTFGFGVLRFVD